MSSPDLGFTFFEKLTLLLLAGMVLGGLSALGGLIVWWFA